jgi:hypothetical protein
MKEVRIRPEEESKEIIYLDELEPNPLLLHYNGSRLIGMVTRVEGRYTLAYHYGLDPEIYSTLEELIKNETFDDYVFKVQ